MAAHSRWRIGIAGIAIECSTFSPHRTVVDDFVVRTGAALLAGYPWIGARATWAGEVEWVPLLQARALPGGPVEAAAYEQLRAGIVDRLHLEQESAAGPLDGLLFDIHGAMSVVGLDDAEADLIAAIRQVIGPDVLVSASMDLHGNVSRELASALDLITCYRLAPHEDAAESRERAARNLVTRLRHGGRPKKAWVQVPVLLPGEKTSTRLEPARGIYARIPDVEALPGVLDAAVWVGYAWADEPRCRAAVVVTGDDEALVLAQARDLAGRYWDARRDFSFVAPTGTLDDCLARALASTRRPFFISDSGDNPTAGGAGDVTYSLARLLAIEAIADGRVACAYTAIVDPAAAAAAVSAGLGARVEVTLGGRIDTREPGPVTLTGEVVGISLDDPVGGDVVALRVGGLTVVLTSRRKQFDLLASWTAVNADPRTADIAMVKLGYLEPELYAIAADHLLALTPGGVDQDLLRLGHHRIRRPLYPFDDPADDHPNGDDPGELPDLTPELL